MSRPAKEKGLFERPKGSGAWWINWYDEEGRRHREKIGPKEAARQVWAKRTTDAMIGKKLPELRRREETLDQLMDRYLPEIKANKKSWEWDVRIQAHWSGVLGDRPARRIQPGDIERVKAEWLASNAPATINRRIAYLKSIYSRACRDGLLESNPLASKRVKMLREAPAKERILSPEEETRLLAAMKTRLRLAATIALHTGLRISELCERRREDVRKDILTIPEAKGGGVQRVRLNPVALGAVRELLASHDSEWLLPSNQGRVVRRVLAQQLARACSAAGVRGVSWHTFRHTFVSRLVLQGENLLVVQQLARHKSLQMTLRYAHLAPDQSAEALDRMAVKWGGLALSLAPAKTQGEETQI